MVMGRVGEGREGREGRDTGTQELPKKSFSIQKIIFSKKNF